MNLKTAHFSFLTTTALRSSKFSGRSAVFMVFVWCDGALRTGHVVLRIRSAKVSIKVAYTGHCKHHLLGTQPIYTRKIWQTGHRQRFLQTWNLGIQKEGVIRVTWSTFWIWDPCYFKFDPHIWGRPQRWHAKGACVTPNKKEERKKTHILYLSGTNQEKINCSNENLKKSNIVKS